MTQILAAIVRQCEVVSALENQVNLLSVGQNDNGSLCHQEVRLKMLLLQTFSCDPKWALAEILCHHRIILLELFNLGMEVLRSCVSFALSLRYLEQASLNEYATYDPLGALQVKHLLSEELCDT